MVEGVSFELQLADKDPPFFDAHGVEVHVLRERTQSSEPPHEPADVCRSVGRGCGGWSGRVDHLFSAAEVSKALPFPTKEMTCRWTRQV